MKKLWSILICVIIILFAAIFFSWNYLPYWISHNLSKKIGVAVSIGHMNLSPTRARILQLSIDNPEGCILDKALTVKKIQANSPITSFLHDNVVIDEVVFSDLYLGLEFESALNTQGNWTMIMGNLRSSLGGSSLGEGVNTAEKKGKSFLIKRLAVERMNIDLVFRQGDGRIRHLKPVAHMEFKNVRSDGPFPMGQLTNIIMSEVLKEVFFDQHLQDMLQNLIPSPGKGAYNSLRSLFPYTKGAN